MTAGSKMVRAELVTNLIYWTEKQNTRKNAKNWKKTPQCYSKLQSNIRRPKQKKSRTDLAEEALYTSSQKHCEIQMDLSLSNPPDATLNFGITNCLTTRRLCSAYIY